MNKLFKKFILAVLGLGGCTWPFSLAAAASGGYSLVVVLGLLIEVISLTVEHGR